MKILFAVNNEEISNAIIKKYQSMYKEIISWKSVYYFNAIIKELQRDKSYDRIIIGEDLEPYTNNNYEVIDNFLADKLDAISDEATNAEGENIPIIIIASERRNKGNPLLVKIFGMGIYNLLMGTDRNYENVCQLIRKPRTKKEAKTYYAVDVDDVKYESTSPESVPEEEMNNIIKHYKKLGKDEEKYVESFNDIAEQYTDMQLKIIAAKLPLNVKAVLEERCPKYQEVMIGSVKKQVQNANKIEEQRYTAKTKKSTKGNRIGLIDEQLNRSKLTKPVVIPSNVNLQNVEKVYKGGAPENENNNIEEMPIEDMQMPEVNMPEADEQEIPEVRRRGRPRKNPEAIETMPQQEGEQKRGRGRPRKDTEPVVENKPADDEPIDIFNLNSGEDDNSEPVDLFNLPEYNAQNNEPVDLFNLPDEDENKQVEPVNLFDMSNNKDNQTSQPESRQYTEPIKPMVNEVRTQQPANYQQNMQQARYQQDQQPSNYGQAQQQASYQPASQQVNYNHAPQMGYNNYSNDLQPVNDAQQSDLSYLLVGDKKIVAFVGTSKNGTSFLVNNLAAMLSQKGINTAILDLTKNKNAYYIYNSNDDNLRNKAFNCIDNLRAGIADGIPVNKNLTVYTTVPGDNTCFDDYGPILETLVKNHSLVLLDCDFETNKNYFAQAQELYLVQTFDILTIQPLTAFLNRLHHDGILKDEKIRVVLNKTLRLKKLTEQMIIGGISCYNDPEATYQNQLFNKEIVRHVSIPFEEQTYAKYLERLADCEITLNGYSKAFLEALKKLSDMVYPLIANNNRNRYQPPKYNNYQQKNNTTNTGFNLNINNTLNKMRKNF